MASRKLRAPEQLSALLAAEQEHMERERRALLRSALAAAENAVSGSSTSAHAFFDGINANDLYNEEQKYIESKLAELAESAS